MTKSTDFNVSFYSNANTNIIYAMSKLALFIEDLNKKYFPAIVGIVTLIETKATNAEKLSEGTINVNISSEANEQKAYIKDLKSFALEIKRFYNINQILFNKRKKI